MFVFYVHFMGEWRICVLCMIFRLHLYCCDRRTVPGYVRFDKFLMCRQIETVVSSNPCMWLRFGRPVLGNHDWLNWLLFFSFLNATGKWLWVLPIIIGFWFLFNFSNVTSIWIFNRTGLVINFSWYQVANDHRRWCQLMSAIGPIDKYTISK